MKIEPTLQELEILLERFKTMLEVEFYQVHSKKELEEMINEITLELAFRYSYKN